MSLQPKQFEDTHWSLILGARAKDDASDRALTELCNAYWYPIYAFIRRKGYSSEEAKDLTQEFFILFLERKFLDRVDKSVGRFRSFLMTCISNFLHDEWRRKQSQKRGGAMTAIFLDFENADSLYAEYAEQQVSPESSFDIEWARTVMARTFDRLKRKHYDAGNQRRFDVLSIVLTDAYRDIQYRELGVPIDMSEIAVRTAVHRLRKEYAEILRAEVAATVPELQGVSEELDFLLEALRGQ